MKLPLYRKITLHTQLTKDQVRQVILENTTRRENVPYSIFDTQPSTKFTGYMYKDYFRIERAITYRNSFTPLISGQLNTISHGTEITLTFKPYAFVVVFIIIWTGGFLFGTIAICVKGLSHGNLSGEALLPGGMLVLVSIIIVTSFNSECNFAKEELVKF